MSGNDFGIQIKRFKQGTRLYSGSRAGSQAMDKNPTKLQMLFSGKCWPNPIEFSC